MNIQSLRLVFTLGLVVGLATAALAGPVTTTTILGTTTTTTTTTTTEPPTTTITTTTSSTSTTTPSDHKIAVCHKGKTLSVDDSSLPAHLDHGDTVGECQ